MNRFTQRTLFSIMLASLMSATYAETSNPAAPADAGSQTPTPAAGGREPHHGPPPEAYQACDGKAVGSEASLTGPNGDEVKGICEDDGDGKPVLRPAHPGEASTRRGPPPEAYQACEGKAAGDAAQLTTHRGDKIDGVCENDASGKLILRPGHPRDGSAGAHRAPPPEAYKACESKAAGDAAQLTNPKGETVKGTCEKDASGKMVLRPDDCPKGGPGRQSPPPEAYKACDGKAAGDAAQLTTPRGDTVKGVCEKDGDKLVLRPDRR